MHPQAFPQSHRQSASKVEVRVLSRVGNQPSENKTAAQGIQEALLRESPRKKVKRVRITIIVVFHRENISYANLEREHTAIPWQFSI